MAERLAPEPVQIRVTSTPERPRGRRRRWVRRLVAAVVVLALVLAAAVATLRFLAVDRSARGTRAAALVPAGMPARVLVLLARPGQELSMAGTLAALDEAGVHVTLLPLTNGEKQTPAVASARRLAGIRADELARSADLLGVDALLDAQMADGTVLAAQPARVTARIARAIEEAQPSVLLTVADGSGRDGDSTAAAAYAVAAAAAGSGVARVWTVTRGAREVRWHGVLGSPLAALGQPQPHVAVRVGHHWAPKGQALLAHGSQSPELLRAVYPMADRIPAWAYFWFWDREYFALAWGEPVR
jgi:LmbE family N-acetylglucosaminyl deacetylase